MSNDVPKLADIARGGAVLVLVRLGRKEPITNRELIEAAGGTDFYARQIRGDLVDAGLIEVEEVPISGATRQYNIRLTPVGREVARKLVEVDEVLKRSTSRDETKRAR